MTNFEQDSLNKCIAKHFTKLVKNKEIEFTRFNYRGVVKIKKVNPPKRHWEDFTVTIKVIKLQKSQYNYTNRTEHWVDRTSVYSGVRDVNSGIRGVVEKEIRFLCDIFSLHYWKVKVTTIDYKTIKND
jgi:hypothetical protein